MKKIRLPGLLLFILFSSACVVQSFFPFYTEETRIPVPAGILGDWLLARDSVTQPKERATLTGEIPWTFTEEELHTCDKEQVKSSVKPVFFKVKDMLFCDFTAASPDQSAVNIFWTCNVLPVHTLCKVRHSKDTLLLMPINPDWLEQALKDNALDLPFMESESSGLLFTATSAQWQEFLATHGAKEEAFSPDTAFELKRRAATQREKAQQSPAAL